MFPFFTSTPKYQPPSPTIDYRPTRPHYELVVFNDCFAHDKCDLWKASGTRKKSIQGYGCAINTLRFLNVIDGTKQTILLNQLKDSGTPFTEIIQYIKELTKTPRKIVEKQFPMHTFKNVVDFFRQLKAWMPNNSCVIYRANLYDDDENYISDLGHTGIFTKTPNGRLYFIDPIYNRIGLHNNDKYFALNNEYVESISLMFQLNLTPLVYQTPNERIYPLPTSARTAYRRNRRTARRRRATSASQSHIATMAPTQQSLSHLTPELPL